MPEETSNACESCGVAPRPFDSVNYGGEGTPSRLLCGRCFNLEVARLGGLVDFEHIDFEPLTMSDAHGREHVFQFRTHLFAAGVTIDAIEFNDEQSEGYYFKVIGDEEGDLFEMLARLVTKMRRGLANSHLEESPHGLQISDPGIVRARIDSDPNGETAMPVVVIDGRNISWDEFGRMVATDLAAQILRLHTVEKWRVGTIARQLHVHRDVVRRVLAGDNSPVHTSPLRLSRIDPYRPFLLATLEKFPTLTAARLHAMVGERGYVGASPHCWLTSSSTSTDTGGGRKRSSPARSN